MIGPGNVGPPPRDIMDGNLGPLAKAVQAGPKPGPGQAEALPIDPHLTNVNVKPVACPADRRPPAGRADVGIQGGPGQAQANVGIPLGPNGHPADVKALARQDAWNARGCAASGPRPRHPDEGRADRRPEREPEGRPGYEGRFRHAVERGDPEAAHAAVEAVKDMLNPGAKSALEPEYLKGLFPLNFQRCPTITLADALASFRAGGYATDNVNDPAVQAFAQRAAPPTGPNSAPRPNAGRPQLGGSRHLAVRRRLLASGPLRSQERLLDHGPPEGLRPAQRGGRSPQSGAAAHANGLHPGNVPLVNGPRVGVASNQ